jgi:regulator of sigma E protease
MEHIATLLHTLLSFLAVISIIVFIHEFGHYFVARLCGVKIDVFSIGFGKEIFGWTSKRSSTRWKLSALPLGGYVKMFGDESAASTPNIAKMEAMSEAEKRVSFHYKPLWQKALIVAAGPVFNFALTISIFTFLIFTYGVVSSEPVVGEVVKDSAAQESGLQTGDRILQVGDDEIENFQDITIAIASNLGDPVRITFRRAGKIRHLTVTPKITEIKDSLGNTVKHPRIGIGSQTLKVQDLGFGGALYHSALRTYQICTTTLKVLGQLVTGQRDTSQLKGPIGIAQMSGQATESGTGTFIWFIAMLSANLGLVNLLPVPLLDGGHLLYYAVEALQGRPLARKVQEIGFKIGFVLLASLMGFTILNDVIGLF